MKQPDLFNGMSEVVENSKNKGWEYVKKIRNYRKSTDKNERCKTCEHIVKKEYANIYYKCALMTLKASSTSDIRVNHVCDLFELTINN